MGYIYPVSTTRIQDQDGTFAGHVARGSINPGTDYAAGYGSPVVSVAAGVVTDTGGGVGGSGGRVIHVNHDDGTGADYLHLSRIDVGAGRRVAQGDQLGLSGASGNGSEWGYGAHLHISFRRNHTRGFSNAGNLDFDALMRSQTTTAATHAAVLEEEEEDMSLKVIRAANGSIALVGERYFGEFNGADKDGVDAAVQTFGPVVPVTNAQYATTKERAKGRFSELVSAISAAVKAP